MKTLNITKGEWKKHYFGENGNRQCRIHSDNVTIAKVLQIDEADANADLIADAANTYNTTPILPSELLKQRNEMLEALERAQKIIEHVINITPTSEQRNLYTHANIIALTAIKSATNA
jgi:CRISPR/Cas system-associated protein Csx1